MGGWGKPVLKVELYGIINKYHTYQIMLSIISKTNPFSAINILSLSFGLVVNNTPVVSTVHCVVIFLM